MSERGGKLTDHRERDRLLYWYVQSFLWGRYASATESIMNRDLHAIESLDGAYSTETDQAFHAHADQRFHVMPIRSERSDALAFSLVTD